MRSLLQTQEWADLKVAQGWKSHNVDGIFVLEKPLPMGKSFLYAPEVEYQTVENLANFLEKIKNKDQICRPIFLRLEILDKKNEEIIEKLKKAKFIKAFEELQPEWRQVINISKPEEEILAQMKQKGRYNIKVAQKHQVVTTICPIDRLVDGAQTFYDLYRQTATHQGISHRGYDYFLKMLEALYPKGEMALFISRYNNVPLAALIITFYDGVATYLYGGTSRLHKNVMAPYGGHFAVIQEAKRRGCTKYDLLAVAPPAPENSSSLKTHSSSHKYAGITYFKEQFGGERVNIVGSYDLIYKPVWYKMFKFAEKMRRR